MKIAIASSGRFHVLDLAVELSKLGHEVVFYSYVPRKRAIKYGLSEKSHRNILPYVAPILLLRKYAPKIFHTKLDNILCLLLDYTVSRLLEPCDALIAMSGYYVNALTVAKEKYGAKVYLERGNQHILAQKYILDQLRSRADLNVSDQVPDYAVERELQGYEIADKIAIASSVVEASFLDQGFSHEKIFKNPYGVDLEVFKPSAIAGLECF